MKQNRISTKIFLPITFILIVFFVISLVVGRIFVTNQLEQENFNSAKLSDDLFQFSEKQDIRAIDSAMIAMQDNPDFINYIKKNDRNGLYEHYLPLHLKLKEAYGITHMYFIYPDGKVFLRVHDQDNFGDIIKRKTFLNAQRNHTTSSGIELGKTAFALRIVKPIYDKSGNLVCYLELGQEIDHFLGNIKAKTSNDYLMLVNKDKISKKDYENLTLPGIRSKWNDISNLVSVSGTISVNDKRIQDIYEYINKNSSSLIGADSVKDIGDEEIDGKISDISVFPVFDPNDQKIGVTMVIRDNSNQVAEINRLYILTILVVLLLVFITFTIVYLLLRRVVIKPIEKIIDGIGYVKLGNLDFRFRNKVNDEIGELCNSYDEMISSLQKSRKDVDAKVREQTEDIQIQSDKLQKQQMALMNILDDVEEEKGRAEILASDLEKFRMAVAGASDHIVITDAEGMILFANQSVERITGFSNAEVMNKKAGSRDLWGGLMPRDLYDKFWDQIKNKKKPYSGVFNNKRKNGDIYQASANVTPILDSKGRVVYFVGIERDITEERKSVAANERLASLIKYTEDAVISETTEGIVVSWNKGAEKLYGYSASDIVGKSIKTVVPKERWGEIDDYLNTIKEGKSIENHQTKRIRKDGKEIDISVTVSPVKNTSGEIEGASIIARDITKEKQVDRAKTEFVSLASHQLRTPLSAINWYTEMLLDEDAGKINKEQREYLEQVYHGNQRMVDLVNALLNVSRLDLGTFTVEPEKINLADISKDVVKELEASFAKKNQVVKESYAHDLPKINADPRLTRIIFQNLLSNAMKYTRDSGKIEVSVEFDDDKFQIKVKDNGMGIPKSQQDKIFTKLFRADNVKATDTEGTGLGMYIVKSIIDEVGGKINFVSEQDKGTTFTICLPKSGMKSKKGSKKLE
ncbi:MAG: PAS domain S-box protein [Thiobacillus sp.]